MGILKLKIAQRHGREDITKEDNGTTSDRHRSKNIQNDDKGGTARRDNLSGGRKIETGLGYGAQTDVRDKSGQQANCRHPIKDMDGAEDESNLTGVAPH
ncbi:uncharacterized protein RHO25_001228 [Cercospora beticola]|uniref:Uncharacterized protein n=1 Tax=Cercospora beticola TaxID=122368 RepID=A0ABZ0NAP7_CERBT|nr:hypothetical protein RHO25_001228 [Cercospora beticola]CAK1355038.1 unnamed protein product [Cercospora beticola]